MQNGGRRGLLISKGWVQAVLIVFLFGFTILGILAYRTYTGQPPIPDRVVNDQGTVLFTGADVTGGQEIFLRNGLSFAGGLPGLERGALAEAARIGGGPRRGGAVQRGGGIRRGAMVTGGVDASTWMAAGYGLFLALVALALELLARRSHHRAEQYQVAGFRYDHDLDVWYCPTDKHLHRVEIRPDRRSVVYRAPAHYCNCCHVKSRCTDSDNGRSVERRLDSWLDSELRRFHLGISLALLVLATSILAIELAAHPDDSDRLVLAVALAIVVVPGVRIGFPFFKPPLRSRSEPGSAECE
jgi:type IV secretory pathway TrbD component